MHLIKREKYLSMLYAVIGTPDIKVITGIRRCGKSKLMEELKKGIREKYPKANLVHINYNLVEYENICEYHELLKYVEERYQKGKKNFLLIDEIQNCLGFEKGINSLHASEKYDIFVTGSNAFLLSSDLATLFTGRTFSIKLFPFSMQEFMLYYKLKAGYAVLDRYLAEGGMPGSYVYEKEHYRYDYVNDVLGTLILRDIRQKYKLRNPVLMDKLVNFLMDNIGNLTSIRSIVAYLSNAKENVNHRTIGKYLEYLCNAFAFYRVPRYDIRGKKRLASSEKYYLCDHVFRYAKLGIKDLDYGRCLENIVAIELLRRGYEVYVGMLYKKEIDFVALKRNEKLYIQVCDNLSDDRTFQREVDPLLHIADGYTKIVLARTNHPEYLYEGIKIIDVGMWLQENDEV